MKGKITMKYLLIALFTLLFVSCTEYIVEPTERTIIIINDKFPFIDDTTSIGKATNYTISLAIEANNSIKKKEVPNLSTWIDNHQFIVGTDLGYAEILKLGFDDINGIRVKYRFSLSEVRNISVNIYSLQYWIGEPIQ